ncbi:MAG: hypothetical protein J5710_01970 [Treponema sp.]|nr:hypothetical protein [Treponema sp.]
MIAALIIILLIILFLAFFIGKNLTNVCTLWLFKTYTDKSVVVVIFIAFAAGIIFSLLCYLIAKFIRLSHENEVADARNLGLKEKKKQDKIDKKLAKQQVKLDKKQKPASVETPSKSENKVESSSKSTDKVNSIEDRIHE